MARARVLTERDVRRAVREGRKEIDAAHTVITPSARDAAARAGIVLRDAGERGAPTATGDGPRSESREHGPAATASDAAAGRGTKPVGGRRVALGADHGGVALKDAISERLRALGHQVTDHGTTGTAAVDYPDYATAVARAVASGDAQLGIMVDGAGIGSCMAANKVPGVRAALCYDVTTAINAREHNNANMLTLGGGLIGPRLALSIVETFVATEFAGGRHAARVAKIDLLDGPRTR